MIYTYLLLLIVLLYNGYVNAAASSNSDQSVASQNQTDSIENVKRKLKLTDLCLDVQYLIAERLDFEDLMYLVEAGPEFSPLAVEVFRRKYKNSKIQIFSARDDMYSWSRYREKLEDENRNNIYLSYLEMILNVFKHFGHIIKHVWIANHNINSNKSAIISKCINKYGNGLTHLTIRSVLGETLEHFKVPFEKLEDLSLQTDRFPIDNNILPFNQMFPNLRRLKLELAADSSYRFIECHFKHLERLYASDIGRKGKERIESLIRENPQIRSIELVYFPTNYVNVINELLPTVENLTLYSLNISNEITMTHVKHFILYDIPESMAKLSFPQLETIAMIYTASEHNQWVDFFQRHRNINKLHLRQREYLNELKVPLVELTQHLSNLTEVTVELSHHLNIEVINQFLENHKQLQKFTYVKTNFASEMQVALQERFENEWNMEYGSIRLEHESNSYSVGIIFERKNLS